MKLSLFLKNVRTPYYNKSTLLIHTGFPYLYLHTCTYTLCSYNIVRLHYPKLSFCLYYCTSVRRYSTIHFYSDYVSALLVKDSKMNRGRVKLVSITLKIHTRLIIDKYL